jgi:hypothetical protein
MTTITIERHADHKKQIVPDIRTNCPALLRDITSHFLGILTQPLNYRLQGAAYIKRMTDVSEKLPQSPGDFFQENSHIKLRVKLTIVNRRIRIINSVFA